MGNKPSIGLFERAGLQHRDSGRLRGSGILDTVFGDLSNIDFETVD